VNIFIEYLSLAAVLLYNFVSKWNCSLGKAFFLLIYSERCVQVKQSKATNTRSSQVKQLFLILSNFAIFTSSLFPLKELIWTNLAGA